MGREFKRSLPRRLRRIMAKAPKPPTSQKSIKGRPSGPTPGKKSAQHGDNSKLGMKASRKKK